MSALVLAVDDSPCVLEGLRFMLSQAGMEAVEASTCRNARRAAKQPNLDAVLLDLKLPDGDGLELLAHLNATRPDLPVLIHTYYDRRSYLARSHALGANGFLVKGLDNHSLLDSIRRVIAGESLWTTTQLAAISRLQRIDAIPSIS